jgi:hypothetical protein
MPVELNARLRTRDGHDAGSIGRAIYDPERNGVIAFVINTGGLFGRDLLMPMRELAVASRDRGVIRLELTKAEVENLPSYLPAAFAPAPADWTPPPMSGFGTSEFLWPAHARRTTSG